MKKLLVIIVVILVLLFLTKNMILGAFVTFSVRSFTNLGLTMEKFDADIFKSSVDIKGMRLYNPKGFPERVMVTMPELYLDYDLSSFITGKKHFKKIRLNLKEFTVVKNEDGELNLDSLKAVQAKMEGAGGGNEKRNFNLQIDVLELKIDKVIYKDYSKGAPPVTKEFDVNIDERYQNITNPYSFVSLVVFKALINTNIANLTNFDLGPLKEQSFEILGNVASEVGTEAGEIAKGTADIIKNILPFGK